MLHVGSDGTHGWRGDVITIIRTPIIINTLHLAEATRIRHVERNILSRCVEISGVYNSRSTDITTRRRRGTIVHPLDDLQGVGGSSRCVICFYDPGFVLLHANRSVVTDPVFYPIGTWQ